MAMSSPLVASSLSLPAVHVPRAARPAPARSTAAASAPGRASQAVLLGLGGVGATAVDVAVLSALVQTGCAVAVAAWLGACVGAVFSYGYNRRVAFRDRSAVRAAQIARFAAVALTSAMAMAAAMHVATALLGAPYLLAKAACSVLVFALWTLPAQRRLVFPAALDVPAPLPGR
jgi:putative flippase GtrA